MLSLKVSVVGSPSPLVWQRRRRMFAGKEDGRLAGYYFRRRGTIVISNSHLFDHATSPENHHLPRGWSRTITCVTDPPKGSSEWRGYFLGDLQRNRDREVAV